MLKVSKYTWLHFHLEHVLVGVFSACYLALIVFFAMEFSLYPKVSAKTSTVLSYETIGQGPFSLNPQYLNPKTPKVLDCLYVTCGSPLAYGDDFIHIGLNDTDARQRLSLNKFNKISLVNNEQESTDGLSRWMIKPLKIEGDHLLAEAMFEKQEPIFVTLPVVGKNSREHQLQDHPGFRLFQKAKYLGQDLLLDGERRDNYRVLLNKDRILNLKSGLRLYFENNDWVFQSLEPELFAEFLIEQSKPLIKVVDKNGFDEIKVYLENVPQERFNHTIFLPKSVRAFPNKTISCFIGKQKFVLKENDWILGSGSFFHVLRSKKEIQSLVDFKTQGPLIVIDEISLSKNLSLVRGKIFSPLRISMHPFEIEAPLMVSSNIPAKNRSKGVKKASL
jgi:hypothetical protein